MDASADLLKVNHRLESRVPEIGLLGSEGGATSSVVPTPIFYFVSILSGLSEALRRVTVFCVRQPLARSSPQAANRKSFWDFAATPKRRFAFWLIVGTK